MTSHKYINSKIFRRILLSYINHIFPQNNKSSGIKSSERRGQNAGPPPPLQLVENLLSLKEGQNVQRNFCTETTVVFLYLGGFLPLILEECTLNNHCKLPTLTVPLKELDLWSNSSVCLKMLNFTIPVRAGKNSFNGKKHLMEIIPRKFVAVVFYSHVFIFGSTRIFNYPM